MKRFLNFGWDDHEAAGGFTDFIGYADTIEEAMNIYAATPWENCQIFDTETGVVLEANHDRQFRPRTSMTPTFLPPDLFTHIDRGGIYVRLADATLQFSGEHVDDTPMVVYRSIEDSRFWVRPKTQFEDGRFVHVDLSRMTPYEMITETARFIMKGIVSKLMESPEVKAIIEQETIPVETPEHNEVDHRVNFGYGRIGHD